MKSSLVFVLLLTVLRAEVLYETDFDNFPVGPNNWAGNDGWISNDTTSGAQAIDSNLLPGLLNTASIGFAQPNSTFTFVARNLGYDHVATGEPIVEIDTLLGVEDSTNNRRDDFFLTIYNSSGDPLASIRFDNDSPGALESESGIWREDGVSSFDTFTDFVPGELYNLVATIDLENNTWSAELDAIPLFTNAPFTATGRPVSLGFVAFEWKLSSFGPLGHGDNFLLVADIAVRSVIAAPELIVTPSFESDGTVSLTWETAAGWVDQVEYSTDLLTWLTDLPDSSFTAPGTANFTDTSGTQGETRYYRVRRTAE